MKNKKLEKIIKDNIALFLQTILICFNFVVFGFFSVIAYETKFDTVVSIALVGCGCTIIVLVGEGIKIAEKIK